MSSFETISALARAQKPFLFVISFDKKRIFAKKLSQLEGIYYKIEDRQNFQESIQSQNTLIQKYPQSFSIYQDAIERVKEEIKKGNSYLLNLTFATPLKSNLSLLEIFHRAKAKFKLYFDDEFICFSPERFIQIENNTISTYPMKGTIDANIPNAHEKILSNPKEMAEHVMMVDLMRNDLSIIANNVHVEKFRYIDKIAAGEKELLQVSSKIVGELKDNWHEHLGEILDRLLPAGSISGTPKKKTVELIEEIENYDRGFYSGIFGLFDGKSLDSAVMIRFIEKQEDRLLYKSGGGITIDSDNQSEYQEMIDKVYFPF
ncbi:MAG: aminodeoxychorismate synthase component I [Campylobacterota bacterium]|nr:aminodeoxychorismate synthase component I [Campylobacterota bacterium]